MSTMRLADGRTLAWAEYGDPAGWPVLYCHGTPGCGAEIDMVFAGGLVARRAGVRLIAPDRPGMGHSSFLRHRSVLDWVRDVEVLTGHLQTEQFSVLGYSGGTGYATALATQLPDKVHATAILASVAPLKPGLDAGLDSSGLRMKELARRHPLLAQALLTAAMRLPAQMAPRRLLAELTSGLPPIDAAVLASSAVREGFIAMLREAFRQGAHGPQHDLALLSDWGFNPSGDTPRLHIWQGTEDTTGARPAMAEHLHAALPGSQLHLSNDGHLSVVASHLEEVLCTITGSSASSVISPGLRSQGSQLGRTA